MLNIKENLIDYANKIGIECIGFTDINFSKEFINNLKHKRENNMLSGFEESDEMKRVNIKSLLKGANSIISIGIPYKFLDQNKDDLYVSKYTLGEDYHKVVMSKLKMLEKFINDYYNSECVLGCDVGVLSDKEIARKAGIGFQGKNSNIITTKYGSYVFLGEIITTLEIESSQELDLDCGNCTLCIDACPSGAISEDGVDGKKCLSYITQKKDDLTIEEINKMGTRVFGCDTCQDICPHNKNKILSNIEEFKPKEILLKLDLEEILFMSNKEFKNKYGSYAFAWRGKHIMQRNLVIASGNSKNKAYIDILKRKESDLKLKRYIEIALQKLNNL